MNASQKITVSLVSETNHLAARPYCLGLILLLTMLLCPEARAAIAIVTPPNSGSAEGASPRTYTWTATEDGFMFFSASAFGCCDNATITITRDGAPVPATFRAFSGANYIITVTATRDAGHRLAWTFNPSPPNDKFSNAIDISFAPYDASGGSIEGSADFATDELPENDPLPPNEVWFRWTAPNNGQIAFGSSCFGNCNAFLVVYQGPSLTSLVNLSGPEVGGTSFQAIGGATYYVALRAGGGYRLSWTFQSGPSVLWAAGRDLFRNEKPDNAAEASASNTKMPQWSYGSRAAVASTALTLFPPGTHVNDASGIEGWVEAGQGTLAVNTKPTPVIFNTGSGNYKPLHSAQLFLSPASPNDFIVARWTAPADGNYRFAAKWLDLDNHGGNGASAHLVINGKEEFKAEWNDGGKARLRAKTFSIKAGDQVDFVLGARGDFTFDGTAFNAAVRRVPAVTVTAPAAATSYSEGQDIRVNVRVEHVDTVQKVALRVDGKTLATDSQAPYEFNFRLESGSHSVTAVATDSQKVKGSSSPFKIDVIKATVSSRSGNTSADGSVSSAAAAGRTYYCAKSGFWAEPSTWGFAGVPGQNDDVSIGDAFEVTLSGNTEVHSVELTGRILTANFAQDSNLRINGILSIFGEIRGKLVLVISEGGQFFNPSGTAVLTDVDFINNGQLIVEGDGLVTFRSSLTNNGQLIVAPPPGGDRLVKLQVPIFTNRGKTSILENGQVVTNSSTLVSGNLALSPAISENGAGLIGNDSAGLIGNDGGTLVGNDGASLIGLDGATLVGNDGASLIGPDGNRLIGLDGGSLITDNGAGLIGIDGGTLTGTGEIRGNLVNRGGFILPGNSAGGILINGNYTQESAATLLLEIGGTKTTPFQYDIFQVLGTANLGGKLIVRTIDGYTPAAGNSLSPLLYTTRTGSFASVSSNAQISFGATGAQVTVTGPNPPSSRALNISTRLQIQRGDNALFASFIITGPAGSTKKVLIRGLGPSLAKLGVAGTIPDPFLELHSSGATITNDNWQQAPNANEIPNGFAPSDPRESLILATLAPGNYSAIIRGAHDEIGVGLCEVYDLDGNSAAQLANIATRGFVQKDDDVLIGGFIIAGKEPVKMLVRVIGPSLSGLGLQGVLTDPELELHDSNGGVIANDDWRSTQETEILGLKFEPPNEKEPAILAVLTPGNYTAVVRGKDNTTGIAVVEAYNLQ